MSIVWHDGEDVDLVGAKDKLKSASVGRALLAEQRGVQAGPTTAYLNISMQGPKSLFGSAHGMYIQHILSMCP